MAMNTSIGSTRTSSDAKAVTRADAASVPSKRPGWLFGKTVDPAPSPSDERAWNNWRELAGSGADPVEGAVVAERTDPEEVIEVLVCLRQKKSASGDATMDRTDLALLRSFADHFGLSIDDVVPTGGLVVMTGPVAAFEGAFRVELHRHRFENGASYRGCTNPVRLPLGIAGIVVGVFGLDNRRLPWRQENCDPALDVESEQTPPPQPLLFANTPARAHNPEQPWAA